ncbi:MAG TPA: glucokinase [Chitinophagaceae bacterium]|nr:glucokinase [Chitinophagaceae bacterium]
MLVPLAFKRQTIDKPLWLLAGDVGGTKVNMALYRADHTGLHAVRQKKFHSDEYKSLNEIVRSFIGNEAIPERICMAVAGPVMDGKVDITNLPWHCDSNALSKELQDANVVFINDLEATAYGLAGLHADELCILNEGNLALKGNIGIIAPGTGLGEAGLFWDGTRYHPFACEGGHCVFASQTQLDFELYQWLKNKFDNISWERLVCGPGIHSIFLFLTEAKQMKVAANILQQMETDDPSAVISEHALAGDCVVCTKTMELFTGYLATEANCLALKYKATGGIFIGGGIPPKILPLLQTPAWLERFFDSDRMQPLLQQVPVRVLLNAKTALLGAAYYGAYSMER